MAEVTVPLTVTEALETRWMTARMPRVSVPEPKYQAIWTGKPDMPEGTGYTKPGISGLLDSI